MPSFCRDSRQYAFIALLAPLRAQYMPRDHLATDSVTGSLLLEVERLKERLQRQADVAASGEAALTSMAVVAARTHEGLEGQLSEARATAAAALSGRDALEAEYERTRTERCALATRVTQLEVGVKGDAKKGTDCATTDWKTHTPAHT
jgi:hypothetical protein